MWTHIASPAERRELQPALVYQEIVSYLKGSAEAVSGADKWLTLEQYLEVRLRPPPPPNSPTPVLLHSLMYAI